MILYIENPKDASRKLLEVINDFCKFAGYKINTQKSVVFLNSNNELSEREIKKTIIYLYIKNNILPRNKPTKEVKYPYSINFDTDERN